MNEPWLELEEQPTLSVDIEWGMRGSTTFHCFGEKGEDEQPSEEDLTKNLAGNRTIDFQRGIVISGARGRQVDMKFRVIGNI